MTVALVSLPKAGSGALRELWESVRRVLDLPRTVLVLEGALDRGTLESVLRKVLKGSQGRPGALSRGELVGRLADAFQSNMEAAYLLMRELDKGCQKERHIIASIEDALIGERLASYRALDFRRERARLVWALVRDARDGSLKAAESILREAFEGIASAKEMERALHAPAIDQVSLDGLRARLASYEAALREQQAQLAKDHSERAAWERERSELMARVGLRERALRDEEQLRRKLEDDVRRLRDEVKLLQARLDDYDPARLDSALAERDRLRERTRALAERAERAERVVELETRAAELEGLVEAEARRALKERQAHAAELSARDEREEALHQRITALRHELHEERRRSQAEPRVTSTAGQRVGVFVDASNLSASARREFGSKLDYRALLEVLLASRDKACAIAFVVNGDGESSEGAFAGFALSLRQAGYEIREKRPRTRADGTRKADWDMGIAMEILDRLDEMDVVVLCSGDGDFVPLLTRLRRSGKRIEVAAFRASADEALVRAADEFHLLDGRFRMMA